MRNLIGLRSLTAQLVSGVLLAWGAFGCGGEDSAQAIGKATFIQEATAICEATAGDVVSEGTPVLRKIERGTGKSGRAAEAAFVPRWLVPKVESELGEIRSLGTPRGDQKEIDTILAALEGVLDLAASNPGRYLYEQANFKHPYRKAEGLARRYGIPACGQP